MEIKYFDKEFVERTKNIVQTQCKDDFEYDVTLLLNCMLGLVSLPTERTKPGQNPFKQECVNKLKNMGVIVNSTDDDKTFRTVKNALSHIEYCASKQRWSYRFYHNQRSSRQKLPVPHRASFYCAAA